MSRSCRPRSPACDRKVRASKSYPSQSKGRTESCSTRRSRAKDANYWDDDSTIDLEAEVDLIALMGHMLKSAPLSGFVVEGLTPYGRNVSNARHRLMLRAAHSGLPVVRVGRGNTEGFVPLHDPSFIGGSNLTATKARLLLMACLMKFGSLPPAADADHPTLEESAAIRKKVAAYQTVFDTH